MTPRKDGVFQATVALERACSYRFRYLHDNERWENCWSEDYIPSDYGTDNSVVTTW